MARALPVLDGETPFQQDYMPVLLDVIKQLKAGLVDSLHSVYVFGSVARREAKAGMSDLNLTVIVQRPLTTSEQSVLSTIRWRITSRYSAVSDVELKVGVIGEVLSVGAIFTWGFWLKHCCICLYGDDLSTRFGGFEPSWDIAKSLNGDIKDELSNYRKKVMATKVVQNYLDYCEYIGKKMLWSCFSLVMHREQMLALSIEQCAEVFLKYYPEKEQEVERLFVLVSRQQVPKKATLFMIDSFGGWIVSEFDRIDRKIG
ncbi:nucleotidyltransferase domain-containing protein [Photobacterium chitinilyticum]|uniref:Nucleotidyltransferase domain-containing protein n=1 Tax=Photobacterium chitinilyticum TaxID=2485123 RepID=A0A444JWL3_9GAMM|nr:nucleotidyltransferase domain-containing protein [Photobacterium chitinilyticum]RWX57482.1 nucleotidyltransferase domain-containing protein [Photobacterium chitinilyticum]